MTDLSRRSVLALAAMAGAGLSSSKLWALQFWAAHPLNQSLKIPQGELLCLGPHRNTHPFRPTI
jgi:hypothetical protein